MAYNDPIPKRKDSGSLAGFGKTYVQVEKIGQIAIVLPCAVLIGWLGGAWLDHKFNQSWITVVGFVLGCAGGMSAAIKMAMALVAEPKRKPGADTKE